MHDLGPCDNSYPELCKNIYSLEKFIMHSEKTDSLENFVKISENEYIQKGLINEYGVCYCDIGWCVWISFENNIRFYPSFQCEKDALQYVQDVFNKKIGQ